MTITDSIKTCFSKYFDFSGRASRSEYWWFALFISLAYIALSLISEVLVLVFMLAVLLPQLAVSARRLHDIDKSGWWLLIILIPLIGLILIYFYLLEGTAGDNDYGAPTD